jgi:hypothetical protein
VKELLPGRSIDIETLELSWTNRGELRLAGTLSTPSAQAEFGKALDAVHAHLAAGGVPTFTVDVRGLNFVNSSVIRVFVTWIARAQRASYRLVFLTDRSITWHRLSFSVLKSLAPATVEILEQQRDGDRQQGVG